VVRDGDRIAMVGRDGELAHLEGALTDAAERHGRTVVIGGEAGIGKTRLVDALADAARDRQYIVLTGACLPTGSGSVPYGPFLEWLRPLVKSVEPGRISAVLGPARSEIARLLPEIAMVEPRVDVGEADRAGSSRLFEAILTVLERQTSHAPVVLVIEDIQWADDETLALTTFLSRNLREAPVLLLITLRSSELDPGASVGRWLAELDRDQWVDRMELRPLDAGHVVALVRSMPGPSVTSDALDAIVERSGGNPFFIEQLAATHAVVEPGLPRRLSDVLGTRIAELPEPTRDLLRVVAAAGRRVDDALLSAVLGVSPDSVADALRPAMTNGILVEVSGPDGRPIGYAFRHALLAEVAYDALLLGERARLHAAFGKELERRGEIAGEPVTPGELAHHWVAARDATRAIPALMQAGLDAERVYAFREALRHYETTLDLWNATDEPPPGVDRIVVLQRAAECAVLCGAYGRAVELGREAIVAAETSVGAHGEGDPVRLGTLHDRMRWFLWEAGDRAAAEAAVNEALRLIPVSPPSSTRARAIGQAAGLRLMAGDPVEAGQLARQAVDVARAADASSEEAFALGILGWSEAVTGDVEGGLATYRAALASAERLGGVEGIALGHANLAALFDRVGRADDALAAAMDGYGVAQRLGVARTYGGLLLATAARAQADLGRWDDALVTIGEGLGLDPVGPAAASLHAAHARIDAARGTFEEAEAHLRVASDLPVSADGRDRVGLAGAAVELAAARGRLPMIRAAIDQLLSSAGDAILAEPDACWALWVALRAEADSAATARAGADAEALRQIDVRISQSAALLDRMDAVAAPDRYRVAIVGLCRAEIDRARDRPEPETWVVLTETWAQLERPALVAYGHYRTGEALIAGRADRSLATGNLRQADEIARRLGAETLRAEIDLLARHARIDLARERDAGATSPADPLGLTEREAEVIRLVAAGRSNQQIADELFITRKTASVHVSNILGKLGVANRVEAAAVAHRLGLGPDDPEG
jgi:DNA-binding NarL/FixJ family response regulator/tetratricopeptide (TPR) repeat protein